jgi:hypothetical protein
VMTTTAVAVTAHYAAPAASFVAHYHCLVG